MEGEGIVSGVCVWDWIERNWRRREEISVAVKPEVRRRSKPRGAGVEGVLASASWVVGGVVL